MQINYQRQLMKRTRKLSLELSGDDIDGLPETLRQEFIRAEMAMLRNRPAQLVSVWSRILGLRPMDPQGALALDDDEEDDWTPPTNGKRD